MICGTLGFTRAMAMVAPREQAWIRAGSFDQRAGFLSL
jgi:hypothetical protein